MPRDFYNIFNYDGIVDYEGESGFHSGQVKKYSMHLTTPSNFWFWYATDLDDKPVEQGEGGCAMFGPSGTRACPNGPKFLFHQYNTSSFKEVTLDPEVFAIPEVVKILRRCVRCSQHVSAATQVLLRFEESTATSI